MIDNTTPRLAAPRAAYVHIPFCRSKCFYCDFASEAGQESLFGAYVEALSKEIDTAEAFGDPLTSVYFGGGTPTILPPDDILHILGHIRSRFGLADDAEVTIEANPGTVGLEQLSALRLGGFNRLSIGVQSFDDDTLGRLGRIHTSGEACEGFLAARRAGFGNVSIDLMYALPDQSMTNWQVTLARAVELSPEHISLYELTVEEGTVFGNLRRRCELKLPDESLQIEMYVAAIETLGAAGYEHYEISNFAHPGRRSRHNQVYWRNDSYYGFGAGASGYVNNNRNVNLRSARDYVNTIKRDESPVESSEAVTGRQSMGETVMLGLRMLEGVDLAAFRERYGVDLADVYQQEIADFTGRGLIVVSDGCMRLTWDGLLIANEVAAEFL
jgi:oxygen-independent coproporphyrinogen-3 oxidase